MRLSAQERQASNDLREARQGLAVAQRAEAQAESACGRTCAGWVAGRTPLEQLEQAEVTLADARRLLKRVEAAEAHLQPLAPARLAGT